MGFVKNSPPSWGSLAPGNRHNPPGVTVGSIPRCFLKGRWAEAVPPWGGEL